MVEKLLVMVLSQDLVKEIEATLNSYYEIIPIFGQRKLLDLINQAQEEIKNGCNKVIVDYDLFKDDPLNELNGLLRILLSHNVKIVIYSQRKKDTHCMESEQIKVFSFGDFATLVYDITKFLD